MTADHTPLSLSEEHAASLLQLGPVRFNGKPCQPWACFAQDYQDFSSLSTAAGARGLISFWPTHKKRVKTRREGPEKAGSHLTRSQANTSSSRGHDLRLKQRKNHGQPSCCTRCGFLRERLGLPRRASFGLVAVSTRPPGRLSLSKKKKRRPRRGKLSQNAILNSARPDLPLPRQARVHNACCRRRCCVWICPVCPPSPLPFLSPPYFFFLFAVDGLPPRSAPILCFCRLFLEEDLFSSLVKNADVESQRRMLLTTPPDLFPPPAPVSAAARKPSRPVRAFDTWPCRCWPCSPAW